MIVALDANALMRDPMCDGLAWRILALGASSWDMAIVVPRVAVIEAVAGYRRRIEHSVEGLDKWATKYVGQLGLQKVHKAAREECRAAAERYAQQLQAVLDSLGAVVLEPPQVPLLEFVERAARRQRPCDDKGNGFRDTLNWLSVIDLARRNPDQEVVWISDDSDFTDQDRKVLHEELVAELREAGVADRVRFFSSVHELVTALVSEHPDRPLDEVRQALRDRALREYVVHQVLPQAINLRVDPRACALPVGTPVGRIAAFSPPADTDWEVEVRGGVDGSAVVSFDVVTEVGMLFDAPAMVGEQPSSLVFKQLKVSGLVTVDDFDRPSAGEITEVAALADDPGAAGWHALDRAAHPSGRGAGPIDPKLLAELTGYTERHRADMERALANISVSPQWRKAINEQQAALSHLTSSTNPTWASVLAQIAATAALWNTWKRPAATGEHDDESGDDAGADDDT